MRCSSFRRRSGPGVAPSGETIFGVVVRDAGLAGYAIASELAMRVNAITDQRTSLRWRGLADEATRECTTELLLLRLVP